MQFLITASHRTKGKGTRLKNITKLFEIFSDRLYQKYLSILYLIFIVSPR